MSGEVYTANCRFRREELEKIGREYEFLGRSSPEKTAENLRFIRARIPENTQLVILLGCEKEYKGNTLEAWKTRHLDHIRYNDAVRREFSGDKNVTLFDVNRFIKSDDDFNDSINHYKKRVYYDMAQSFIEMINERAGENTAHSASKQKLAYMTAKQKIKKLINGLTVK